jgi:methionyl-tRNA formyltransferase
MAHIIFMGSPQFAVPTLEALARDHTILAVFTQPDKPAGRGQQLTAVPAKQWAVDHRVPVHQPKSFRKEPQAIDVLRELKPKVIVVAAYGLILPQAVLDVPPLGCLNVHGSILPRHRGAAPITSAILTGDAETGITIMKMDAGLDTGPMLSVAREAIRPDDTTASLSERLSHLGAQLMADTLSKYLSGEIVPQPQPAEGATYSPKIDKADAQIDWSKPAIEIERKVRAYTPWPGTQTMWNGQMVKVLKAQVIEGKKDGEIGKVVKLSAGSIGVVTGEGVLVLKEIQLAGRKAMQAEDFVRGQPKFIEAVLGQRDGETA